MSSTQHDTTTVEVSSRSDELQFEDACHTLTEWLDDINPEHDDYESFGEQVGWRNVSGSCEITLSDGRDLITQLTPHGEWNITAEKFEDSISIELSHHDSPTGETHDIFKAQ